MPTITTNTASMMSVMAEFEYLASANLMSRLSRHESEILHRLGGPQIAVDRKRNGRQNQSDQNERERAQEELHAPELHRLVQRFLRDLSEHEPDHERRARPAGAQQSIADHAQA